MLENPGHVGSAEAVSHPESPAVRRDDPPIDLVHLTHQCQGDPDLGEELLGLFRLQARALAAQLSEPSTMSPDLIANIAHKLRGSALTVGATRVAHAAEAMEESARAARDRLPGVEWPSMAQAAAELREAVAEATAEIERLRG